MDIRRCQRLVMAEVWRDESGGVTPGRVAIWIVGGLFLSILGQVVGWGGFLAGMFGCNWKQVVRYAGIAGLAGMIFAWFMGYGPFPQPDHWAYKSYWGGSTAWWLVGVTLCWWGLALLFAIPSHLYWRRKRRAANPLAAMGEYQRTRVFPSMDGTVGRREPTLHRQEPTLHRQELLLDPQELTLDRPLDPREPTLHRQEPTLHRQELLLDRQELTLDRPEPMLDLMPDRREPTLGRAEPMLGRRASKILGEGS